MPVLLATTQTVVSVKLDAIYMTDDLYCDIRDPLWYAMLNIISGMILLFSGYDYSATQVRKRMSVLSSRLLTDNNDFCRHVLGFVIALLRSSHKGGNRNV